MDKRYALIVLYIELLIIPQQEEDITFGDGTKATERMVSDIMALLPEGHICFVGWVGRLCFKQGGDSVVRVDYEKYIDGAIDYIIE